MYTGAGRINKIISKLHPGIEAISFVNKKKWKKGEK